MKSAYIVVVIILLLVISPVVTVYAFTFPSFNFQTPTQPLPLPGRDMINGGGNRSNDPPSVPDSPQPETPHWGYSSAPKDRTGEPLCIRVIYDKPITITSLYPQEQHESFHYSLNLFNTPEPQKMDRRIHCYQFMMDWNGDGILTPEYAGVELLFDEEKTVYEILDSPIFDTNNNGWLDKEDFLWDMVLIKLTEPLPTGTYSWSTEYVDQYFTPEDLQITAINFSHYLDIPDDYTGNGGTYSDCKYVEDWAFNNAVKQYGPIDNWCEIISLDHFRVWAFNPNGVLFENGVILPTYALPMGWYS